MPAAQMSIIKPQGAEIRIGDYGWEAGPDPGDGLIYLQGLAPDWTVVWHTGFSRDEVERVAEKPTSQYDYSPERRRSVEPIVAASPDDFCYFRGHHVARPIVSNLPWQRLPPALLVCLPLRDGGSGQQYRSVDSTRRKLFNKLI